jgi:small subunit ribosomal protein S17
MAEEIENAEDAATEAPETGAVSPETAVPEAPADAPAPAAAATAPAAPAEVLPPKERRARARSQKAAQVGTRPSRSPEERQADRDAARAKKAAARRVERQRARAKSSATPSATPPEAREHETRVQKTRQGVVVSDRADKTITVRIDVSRRHRRYEKIVRTSNTLHAHDETNDAHLGDTVIVRECRPLSRTKRWRLVEVIERAK